MPQHITKSRFAQLGHFVVVGLVLVLAGCGRLPESQAGWLTCPPPVGAAPVAPARRPRPAAGWPLAARLRCCGQYLRRTWATPVQRTIVLAVLWWWSGRPGPGELVLLPLLLALAQTVAVGWPELAGVPGWAQGTELLWHSQRLVLGGYLLWGCWTTRSTGGLLGVGLGVVEVAEPRVEVTRTAEGDYTVDLWGHMQLHGIGADEFPRRMLMVFLRQLEDPAATRSGRRTRAGRTPLVRQWQMQEWFGILGPVLSRLERDWQRGDWANLLSQRLPAEVLTTDLRTRIVTTGATFPYKNADEIYTYLHEQQVAVSHAQVHQAMAESGWTQLRQELQQRYHWTPERFQWSDAFLVQELLRLTQSLLDCLEQGQPLPVAEQVALADLRALAAELGTAPPPPVPARPWLLRLQTVLFGTWEPVTDPTIRCPHCGSADVGRKSRQPRMKKFWDADHHLQEVAVYRYYCRNAACPQQTFTHLPPGLLPYSPHRLEVHALALQAYAWSYSTYRRVGPALAVRAVTVYRWVRAWGAELLPVAALFGVVRSSGVVGVDEKYVLVPKNDKPAGKNRRWMYVYLAVDVYTYDLLHIALYPHNNQDSARAFLLALRTKGYHPRVIVTDLRRDYGAVIAQVFAQARHHECIFHAEQDLGRYLRDTWGPNYAETHPAAAALQEQVTQIFQAQTKRTAQRRYQALRAQQAQLMQAHPPLQWVFDFLEKHWDHLVNAVESTVVPRTNNAVELVIRRFDQHYQNFCGFESQTTAQVYLGVFEKVYRFTPFSDDAQAAIRGKSPLELAGYDLRQMPMPWLFRGLSLDWPILPEGQDVVVPNP